MNFLRMAAVPVLERLHLEERLLRTSADNWCIVNDGTNHLAIVICNKNAIPGLQPYPRPIYHGPANCMARCFMDLVTSISVKMVCRMNLSYFITRLALFGI